MTERQPTPEKCDSCPNRGKISKALARVAGSNCEGPVTVSHGVIRTYIHQKGESSEIPEEFKGARMVGDSEEERYSKTDWTSEVVCGLEPIEPREGEVPYSPSRPTWTNEDGSRYAAFVSGDTESLRDHYAELGVEELLDAVSEVQAAEDANNPLGEQTAHDKIAARGLSLAAVVGRGKARRRVY